MKSLQTIQTLSKIGKVLSRIAFIFSIIGAAGCAVGMAGLPFGDTGIFKIGGVTIYGLIVNRAGINIDSLYPTLAGAMIVCIGEIVLAKFAERYFAHELAAGTPFTENGAKEMLRLGILTICIPLGALLLARIVSGVIADVIGCGEASGLETKAARRWASCLSSCPCCAAAVRSCRHKSRRNVPEMNRRMAVFLTAAGMTARQAVCAENTKGAGL